MELFPVSTQVKPTSRTVKTLPLSRRQILTAWFPIFLLGAIIVFGAVLRFNHLESANTNSYYAAAVKSMLTSPYNFFFVSAEPGGSVTVDKPPLGLWLQAISAFFLGVNSFALLLPQALAGTLAIPLLYHLIKRWFGHVAGLVAAFVLAVMPVTIATERNNTSDGVLVFLLLLAAWAFVRAAETGKLRLLLIGAVLVGLGFNVKMLQAFLPLPAFYALYLFGAPVRFNCKVWRLAIATGMLLVVSLSWAVVVDSLPPESRPYIGSSSNNSVMDLIVGYNGLGRLFGQNGTGSGQGMMTTMFAGEPGPLRLFAGGLAKEASWLLVPAIIGLLLLVGSARIRLRALFRTTLPLTHQAAILWGGWLFAAGGFFSVAGFFHEYYLIMLGPPIAALFGITVGRLWTLYQVRPRLTILLAVVTFGLGIAFQYSIALRFINADIALIGAMSGTVLIGTGMVGLIVATLRRGAGQAFVQKGAIIALLIVVAGSLVFPTAWAAATATDPNANAALPVAYSGTLRSAPTGFRGQFPGGTRPNAAQPPSDGFVPPDNANGPINAGSAFPPGGPGMPGMPGTAPNIQPVLDYIGPRTLNMKYLLAVGSAMSSSEYILQTGRPVLIMGGFLGSDPVVNAEKLAAMVTKGDLRFIADPAGRMGGGDKQQISQWLQKNCAVAQIPGASLLDGTIYDCAVS